MLKFVRIRIMFGYGLQLNRGIKKLSKLICLLTKMPVAERFISSFTKTYGKILFYNRSICHPQAYGLPNTKHQMHFPIWKSVTDRTIRHQIHKRNVLMAIFLAEREQMRTKSRGGKWLNLYESPYRETMSQVNRARL